MAASNEKMIRGKAALARLIFGDDRKRRLIPKLTEEDGWPIFNIAGKPAAYPAALKAAVARKAATKRRRQRRKTKQEAVGSSAA